MTWGDTTQTPPREHTLGVTLGVYRLVQRLGEGGMGVVHLALDPHGRAVAVKVLRAHVAYDPDARARLNREVATLSRVRHRLVAEVLDADVEGDRPYVVTRYVPGPTLDAEVRERGPMPPGHLVQLGRGLSSALQAIHEAGVVHRDLKPANVLLLDGDPVVIDFGIAHVADDIRLTMTGLVMGTPGYLSPELIEGAEVTAATDWWGWAATLAFAASGEPPFGRGPGDVVIDRVRRGAAELTAVDTRLRPLLLAALAPDPAVRPGAPEVLSALERFALGGQATVPVPAVPPTRPLPGTTAAVVTPPTRLTSLAAPVAPAVAVPRPAAPPPDLAPAPPVASPDDDPLGLFAPPAQQSGDPGAPRKPRRTGTLLAVLCAVVGLGSCWPTLTALVTVALVVLARTVDRAFTASLRRRDLNGPRGSDAWVAAATAPWHLVRSAVVSGPAVVLPVVLGVSAALLAGVASGATAAPAGPDQVSATQTAATAGLLVGVLVTWWGPGGASVRRGARELTRGVVRGRAMTSAVVVGCLLAGAAAAYFAYTQGQPDFSPLHSLPLGISLPG
ncbi:MAG: protein kinase domain-containing protein [Actinomycetales bacterium]